MSAAAASLFTPIDMSKIIPLVTGGGSGIGLGLVHEFIKLGSPKVIITGRRESVLQQAAAKYNNNNSDDNTANVLYYKVSDAGNAQDRQELFDWIKKEHPDCNALVNNAGIQRRIAPVLDHADWKERQTEIEINLSGPVHLSTLFIPYFLSKTNETCLLVNVSSGLAFVPFPGGPVYSATKAAIHSYSVAMRYSLQGTNVKMIEIVPPAVKSNLGGSHDFGEECDEFCAAVMERVAAGEPEVGYKFSETARLADRQTLNALSDNVAANMRTPRYDQVE